jgi:hypothetical protein
MNNKVLVGGLIGGVVFFLLGWLVYGMALTTMMTENTMAGINRPMEEMQWAFLIIGHFAFGFLMAYILDKSNVYSFGSGATMGAVIGFLFALAFDFIMYATTNYYTTMSFVFIDIIVATVMSAIVAGVVGWWYGRKRPVVVA